MEKKVILLDLGGVVIEYTGLPRMAELAGGGAAHDEFAARWAASEFVRLYESGRCDTETFAEGVVREFGFRITPGDFLDEFPFYVRGFFPGAAELLREIRGNHTLACLSNTNVMQWEALRERIRLDKYFDRVFLSFEMKMMKPDPEIYEHVIRKLGCAPGGIAFFDDSAANVEAADAAGMNAHRVLGAEDLRDRLTGLGLL